MYVPVESYRALGKWIMSPRDSNACKALKKNDSEMILVVSIAVSVCFFICINISVKKECKY